MQEYIISSIEQILDDLEICTCAIYYQLISKLDQIL